MPSSEDNNKKQSWKQSSLVQRLVTAIFLVPIVVVLIFFLSNLYFSFVAAFVCLGGAWEWSNFLGLKTTASRLFYVLQVAIAILILSLLSSDAVYVIALFWWAVSSYAVLRYPMGAEVWGKPKVIGLMGYITLSLTWYALVDLQSTEHGSRLVLFIMCIVWGADTGAYFAGRRWGKMKLAPKVSPGKSIAGLLGGVFVTISFTLLVLSQLDLAFADKVFYLFLTLLTVVASVLGDLYESMLKRHAKVKDSGSILPGHGGLLDRIDSLTAAVPVFTAGLYFNGAFS